MENATSPLTPGLTFSVVMVTPELAAEWLEQVKIEGGVRVQRALTVRRVERYAADMEMGQWPFLGDPVRFSLPDPVSGVEYAIDGQHRFAAIVESEVAVPLLIIRGFPFELIQQVDVGARRTFVNYLQMHGVANPGDVASTTTMLYHWKTGKFGYKGMPRVADPVNLSTEPTHAELWALFRRYPVIPQAVKAAAQVYRMTNKQSVRRSQLALLYILLSDVDIYKREAFFAELVRTEPPLDTTPGYPISTLRDRWSRQTASDFAQARSLPRWAWLAFLIKGWNAYYDGSRLLTLVAGQSSWHILPQLRGLIDEDFDLGDDTEEQFKAGFDEAPGIAQ